MRMLERQRQKLSVFRQVGRGRLAESISIFIRSNSTISVCVKHEAFRNVHSAPVQTLLKTDVLLLSRLVKVCICDKIVTIWLFHFTIEYIFVELFIIFELLFVVI